MPLHRASQLRRCLAVVLTLALLGSALLLLPSLGFAQEGGAAPAPAAGGAAPTQPPADDGNPMVKFLFGSVTGYVLMAIYLSFVALLVWLTMDLRAATIMPADLVETLEDALNKRKYKEAFGIVQADNSMLGRILTAGMTRMQHGLDEAREAAGAMLDSLRARREGVLSYVAIIGTLGPLIGLVGTVSGMIQSFGELGRGGTPNPAKLAEGISHALNATLVGIFLSCLAIPSFSYFKNRLTRIINDASLLVDDLLTQMYHSSRGANVAGSAKSVPPTAAPATVPGKPVEG